MTQHPSNFQKGHTQVELIKPADVLYWTNTFNVSETLLREAIQQVGNNPKEITVYLCQQRMQGEKTTKTEHG